MSGEEGLSVPPGCRCVFGAEWAGGFDSDGCAAHGPAFAAITARVATLTAERDDLLRMVDEFLSHDEPNETFADRLNALVRRVRGGT